MLSNERKQRKMLKNPAMGLRPWSLRTVKFILNVLTNITNKGVVAK